MFLGIDIGSSSSKAALVDTDGKLVKTDLINMGTGSDAAEQVVSHLLVEAGIEAKDIFYTVATGYGRMNFKGADMQITEITCHGKGVSHMMPSVRTIIDIGGQDVKVIRLNENGVVENFVMNEKCAAGTGRFLEVMARIIGCDIEMLSSYADASTKTVLISSTCTVFAESEVISQLANGEKREDVARGAHISVAKRVSGLASRLGVVPNIGMTGGVALNHNLVQALEQELENPIITISEAQCMGAIGAALLAKEKYEKLKKS